MNNLPHGEITAEDEKLLVQTAKEASLSGPNSTAVEIGTFLGRSAIVLSWHIGVVYTIDVFEDYDLIENEVSRLHYEDHLQRFPRTYREVKESLSAYKNIYVIKGYSLDKTDIIKDGSLSLLFLDGDHTFNGLRSDFEAWYPKLRTGGYMVVHDSGPYAHWMEPILFVKTITDKMTKTGESDISTAWRKI